MSVAQADIERIVREVMEQLKLAAAPAAALASAAPANAPLAAPPKHNGELVIDCRVVTLESISGRLNGAKQLVVAPGALVTPSVRDELRRRGVELVQDSAAKKTKKPLAPVLLVVGRTGHSADLAVAMLRQDGLAVQSESTDCLIEATEKLASAAAAGALGVLWTRHTAVGLCLANRRRGVRAVLATSVAATAAAVAAVGANVLVIDPTIGTTYEKKQVLRDFCLGGIRECPEALKKNLG
jgi:hypothetical protein